MQGEPGHCGAVALGVVIVYTPTFFIKRVHIAGRQGWFDQRVTAIDAGVENADGWNLRAGPYHALSQPFDPVVLFPFYIVDNE
jgi:hypothetical protein